MNKRATIEYGLLVAVAIAIYITEMALFLSLPEEQISPISGIAYEIDFNQNYVVAQSELILSQAIDSCSDCSDEQLKQKFRAIAEEKETQFRYEGAGNFYGKIRNSEFSIENNQLTISGIFIESSEGENKIKRNFNLTISLNEIK